MAAQALAKRAIDAGLDITLGGGLDLEQQLFAEVFETEDARIGVELVPRARPRQGDVHRPLSGVPQPGRHRRRPHAAGHGRTATSRPMLYMALRGLVTARHGAADPAWLPRGRSAAFAQMRRASRGADFLRRRLSARAATSRRAPRSVPRVA